MSAKHIIIVSTYVREHHIIIIKKNHNPLKVESHRIEWGDFNTARKKYFKRFDVCLNMVRLQVA